MEMAKSPKEGIWWPLAFRDQKEGMKYYKNKRDRNLSLFY